LSWKHYILCFSGISKENKEFFWDIYSPMDNLWIFRHEDHKQNKYSHLAFTSIDGFFVYYNATLYLLKEVDVKQRIQQLVNMNLHSMAFTIIEREDLKNHEFVRNLHWSYLEFLLE
jgi:hypothetical protein